MRVTTKVRIFAAAVLALAGANVAHGSVYITEWMYQGSGTGGIGEFVQFTNTGPNPVDMTGWSFDDNTETPGSQDLSGFGTVASGESVIFTELAASDFVADWNLDPSVKVVGGNMNNLGRSDEINLYDNTNTLVDRLTYNDQAASGNTKGPRTNSIAAYIPTSDYGQNNASLAVAAMVGDSYGSRASSLGEIGNPGPVATPEPASLGLLAVAGLLVGRNRRQRA